MPSPARWPLSMVQGLKVGREKVESGEAFRQKRSPTVVRGSRVVRWNDTNTVSGLRQRISLPNLPTFYLLPSTFEKPTAHRSRPTLAQSEAMSLRRLRVERDDPVALGDDVDANGAAADATVLDVGLLPHRRVDEHGDRFSAVGTRKALFEDVHGEGALLMQQRIVSRRGTTPPPEAHRAGDDRRGRGCSRARCQSSPPRRRRTPSVVPKARPRRGR